MLKLFGAIFLASHMNNNKKSISSKNPAKAVRRGPVVVKWYTPTDVSRAFMSHHVCMVLHSRLHTQVSAEKRRKCQVRARGISIWRSCIGSSVVITGNPRTCVRDFYLEKNHAKSIQISNFLAFCVLYASRARSRSCASRRDICKRPLAFTSEDQMKISEAYRKNEK